MAQMLDARTAIALARTPNIDQRFFLKPPYFHVEYNLHVCKLYIILALHMMLKKLIALVYIYILHKNFKCYLI